MSAKNSGTTGRKATKFDTRVASRQPMNDWDLKLEKIKYTFSAKSVRNQCKIIKHSKVTDYQTYLKKTSYIYVKLFLN